MWASGAAFLLVAVGFALVTGHIGQQHLPLAQSTFKESCLHFGVTSCILNTLNLEMGIRTQHAPQAVCNVCNHYK